jgi:flagellar basal-body rod modification protein FlgD
MMLQPLQSSANILKAQNGVVNRGDVNPGGGANGAGQSSFTNSLDYDDFLTLLVMQLRYQDPLNPMENQEFIAQNAQFSTVEQLIAIKDMMAAQASTAEAANASYATNMIGKLVAADVSDYNEAGEYEERFITGVVEEVTFVRSEGAILVKLDSGAMVYLHQIVSVREAPEE